MLMINSKEASFVLESVSITHDCASWSWMLTRTAYRPCVDTQPSRNTRENHFAKARL